MCMIGDFVGCFVDDVDCVGVVGCCDGLFCVCEMWCI